MWHNSASSMPVAWWSLFLLHPNSMHGEGDIKKDKGKVCWYGIVMVREGESGQDG